MRSFLICVHDATPAFTREMRVIIRDLGGLVDRRISFGVVPDWHDAWPLRANPLFCELVAENSDELLLHGYCHRRARGVGLTTLLTGGSDEMNGLDPQATADAVERGQAVFSEVFGGAARGFLPPAWQRGHVHVSEDRAHGLSHVMGFFSLDAADGRSVPLATWSWDCGRWAWLGRIGHGVGSLLHSLNGRVPVLAIHPLDIRRGYWPRILRLTRELLDTGFEPSTPGELIGRREC